MRLIKRHEPIIDPSPAEEDLLGELSDAVKVLNENVAKVAGLVEELQRDREGQDGDGDGGPTAATA